MDDLSFIFVTGLAAWRLVIFLIEERGPFSFMLKLRERFGIEHDDVSDLPVSWPDSFPGSLFSCLWCLSFWTSAFFFGMLWIEPLVVYAFAVWGAAVVINQVVLKGR